MYSNDEFINIIRRRLSEARFVHSMNVANAAAELAKKYGFKYGRVFIKNQKTLWGSCSYRNNINLNLNLVALNDEFIDYVLLHELTHTVHKNHQKAFYDLLKKNMPNALDVQKRLKKIKISNTYK